jgi:hypothetical protein
MNVNESIESVNDISNNSKLHGIIIDLKNIIDDYDYNFKKFQELILELARRLNEEKSCEQDKISQIIKEILKDKIKEGKITAKWIEECLPTEYKRKYIIKSEQSSLSKKKKDLVSITNEGEGKKIDDISIPYNKNELDYPVDQSDKIQTYELEEALREQQQFLMSDQILSEETLFLVPKEKFHLIKESIEKSNKVCYLKFDKNKILREAQPDIAVT